MEYENVPIIYPLLVVNCLSRINIPNKVFLLLFVYTSVVYIARPDTN